jgi:hypothetical protein
MNMKYPNASMNETVVAWGDDSLALASQPSFPNALVRHGFPVRREDGRG